MVQREVEEEVRRSGSPRLPYDRWMLSTGLPIHRGHYVADPNAVEVGRWEERGVNAAFIQLVGMQGVCEARITELPAGGQSKPFKLGVSEIVYGLQGQGLTTVWAGDGPKKTFEWNKHSMFIAPRNCWVQYTNTRGDQPARLLNYNHLPLALSSIPDLWFFFNSQLEEPDLIYPKEGEEFYADAKMVTVEGATVRGTEAFWSAHFIPDMNAWDQLLDYPGRGAGGKRVVIRFPGVDMGCHMSVFDPQLYKKGHKHGPGRIIVIPKGEGYSVLTPGPGVPGERAVCHWQECSIFVPPDNWYHQHFNTGATDARYLALAPVRQFGGNPYRHQIEYPDEDPWVREYFQSELAKKGLKSLMPDECYANPNYEFAYGNDKD